MRISDWSSDVCSSDLLAEPGDGLAACREFIRKSDRRHAGLVGSRRAMKLAWHLELDELNRITEMWADTALQLREQDLKVMNRLVAAQRSEEHTSELQSLMRISYAVFCLKKKNKK